ncbi:MAG: phytanoyl-CoA dioxygenase family protein, partial [Cyanobacteria bacterium P01_A01_bin.83]
FPQPFYVARYFNISHDCPQIIQLVNDPKLREIATKYIGKQAKYTGSSLFWTFPVEGESSDWEQQKFRYYHYDIDDVSGMRFCFYLTDVTLDNGPHVCIKGSHVKKSLSHVLNYLSRIQPETELAKVYDPEQFLTITGKSGYGFIEDTFCFHKGAPPQNQPRLFLQLHFAIHNYNQEQSYLDVRDPKTLQSYPLFQETCIP